MFSFIILSLLLTIVSAENWATYPQVPQTASINGFADPIYSKLPTCAQDCVKVDTGNTPCPYWDTGCFCVMPQWSGEVAECFASSCSGSDVVSATSLAKSLCNSVGAETWMIPASASTEITGAEGTATAIASALASTTSSTNSKSSSVTSNSTSSVIGVSSDSTSPTSALSSTPSSSNNAAITTSSILGIFLALISLV